MILLPQELRDALRANARHLDLPGHDPVPLVKFFNPLGAATWLATELYEDDDTLFGLADLGFGCPELGPFSLSELAGVRLPFGLGIERDIAFTTNQRLSTWAAWSRRAGSILHAETIFNRPLPRADEPAHEDGPELPPGDTDG